MNPFATLVAQVTRDPDPRQPIVFRVQVWKDYRPTGNALTLIYALIDAGRPVRTTELSRRTGVAIRRIPAILSSAVEHGLVVRHKLDRGSTWELISENYRNI